MPAPMMRLKMRLALCHGRGDGNISMTGTISKEQSAMLQSLGVTVLNGDYIVSEKLHERLSSDYLMQKDEYLDNLEAGCDSEMGVG